MGCYKVVKIITQLGKSKKYANGSIHENASGTFQILDRYLSPEGVVMLKIEWLTGSNAGQIEDNKEENVNASIYKYEQSRGLLGSIEENKDVVTLKDIYDLLEDMHRINKIYEEDRRAIVNERKLMEEKLHAQTTLISDIAKQLHLNTEMIKYLGESGDKRDEHIREIANTVDKNTMLIEAITNNVTLLQNQQKMIDKLLEKI